MRSILKVGSEQLHDLYNSVGGFCPQLFCFYIQLHLDDYFSSILLYSAMNSSARIRKLSALISWSSACIRSMYPLEISPFASIVRRSAWALCPSEKASSPCLISSAASSYFPSFAQWIALIKCVLAVPTYVIIWKHLCYNNTCKKYIRRNFYE